MKTFEKPPVTAVIPRDPFFAPRVKSCLMTSIPLTMEEIRKSGKLDAFKLDWKEGMPHTPHVFWDSDTAKVLEGMAYSLAIRPDPELEKEYDRWVDIIVSAQREDGYLNTHFLAVEPEKIDTVMGSYHVFYCAGHLMEAAVAGYEYLGKRKLLDALCRYADYFVRKYGTGEGQKKSVGDHEELELAMMKLYYATGVERYRDFALYLINGRGVCFEDQASSYGKAYAQEDQPVREQTTAHGHAVRAVYLYSGMAEVGNSFGDQSLLDACERLFDSIAKKRMYITGNIGSCYDGESFGTDYELANGSGSYGESCGSIGLAQFARRMYLIAGKEKYASLLEKVLYNGIFCGVSLKGDTYLYENHQEVDENFRDEIRGKAGYSRFLKRQEFMDCSCCVTSFCRFPPQVSSFFWCTGENEAHLLIPAANEALLTLPDARKLAFTVEGSYPYDGKITITVKSAGKYTLSLRIPDWCRKYSISLNGEKSSPRMEREWKEGDRVEMLLDMPIEIMYSNGRITTNRGRIALQRGPLVYALEEIDMEFPVRDTVILADRPMKLVQAPGLPEGTVAIEGEAVREVMEEGKLYSSGSPRYEEGHTFRAIPYALWQNRGFGAMAVWIRKR